MSFPKPLTIWKCGFTGWAVSYLPSTHKFMRLKICWSKKVSSFSAKVFIKTSGLITLFTSHLKSYNMHAEFLLFRLPRAIWALIGRKAKMQKVSFPQNFQILFVGLLWSKASIDGVLFVEHHLELKSLIPFYLIGTQIDRWTKSTTRARNIFSKIKLLLLSAYPQNSLHQGIFCHLFSTENCSANLFGSVPCIGTLRDRKSQNPLLFPKLQFKWFFCAIISETLSIEKIAAPLRFLLPTSFKELNNKMRKVSWFIWRCFNGSISEQSNENSEIKHWWDRWKLGQHN